MFFSVIHIAHNYSTPYFAKLTPPIIPNEFDKRSKQFLYRELPSDPSDFQIHASASLQFFPLGWPAGRSLVFLLSDPFLFWFWCLFSGHWPVERFSLGSFNEQGQSDLEFLWIFGRKLVLKYKRYSSIFNITHGVLFMHLCTKPILSVLAHFLNSSEQRTCRI